MANEKQQSEQFEAAARQRRPGLVRDFWDFLRHNKKWWLGPILLILLVIGLLVILAGTPLGQLMYSFF